MDAVEADALLKILVPGLMNCLLQQRQGFRAVSAFGESKGVLRISRHGLTGILRRSLSRRSDGDGNQQRPT